MAPQPLRKPLGIVGLFALGFFTASCARSEARHPPAEPEAVMQAIRDYGRGYQALLTPGPAEKPDQTDEAYSARIRNILVQEDFAQLEKIAQQNRVEKGRLLGGVWKILAFYNGTGWPVSASNPTEPEWQSHIGILKKWIGANPNSTAARLSLAYLYVNYSWVGRGGGFADSITDAKWELFYERNAQAKAILLQASSFKDKDLFWYELMQLVAHNEGWKQPEAREVFNQAVSFEPGYYHYYMEYTHYLLPQWYGKPGDIQAFAEEISSHVTEPDSSMFYFWIMSSRACYCQEAIRDLPQVSYPKFKTGYSNVSRFYGLSNLNANRFAYMATRFNDRAAAREAFASVTKMEGSVFMDHSVFDKYSEWANEP